MWRPALGALVLFGLAMFGAVNSIFERDALGMLLAAGGIFVLGLLSAGFAIVEGRARGMHLPPSPEDHGLDREQPSQ